MCRSCVCVFRVCMVGVCVCVWCLLVCGWCDCVFCVSFLCDSVKFKFKFIVKFRNLNFFFEKQMELGLEMELLRFNITD